MTPDVDATLLRKVDDCGTSQRIEVAVVVLEVQGWAKLLHAYWTESKNTQGMVRMIAQAGAD